MLEQRPSACSWCYVWLSRGREEQQREGASPICHLEEKAWESKFEVRGEEWEHLFLDLHTLKLEVEAVPVQCPRYLFSLEEEQKANMEIDNILEDLERRMLRMSLVPSFGPSSRER